MLTWLLVGEAQVEPSAGFTEPLAQYGAIGFFGAICVYAVYKLFNSVEATRKAEIERIEAAHRVAIERADAAYDKEVARGDRMESGLRDLNELINNKLAGELANATDAIREALEMTRDRRRQ